MNSFVGTLTAEVLSPDGRLPVNIRKPDSGKVQVGFTAKVEGILFLLVFLLQEIFSNFHTYHETRTYSLSWID